MSQFRLVSHADDDLSLPGGEGEGEALRVWLSEQQWMAILERIERQARADDGQWINLDEGGDRRDPRDPRRPISARCIIRVGAGGHEAGTYIVRTRNISTGGLGFIHHHDLRAGTRCTIALQIDTGQGMIVAGRIAWCREVMQLEVEEATYEIGVQFDRPIGLGAFNDEVA